MLVPYYIVWSSVLNYKYNEMVFNKTAFFSKWIFPGLMLTALFFAGCKSDKGNAPETAAAKAPEKEGANFQDSHSFSNIGESATRHIDLDLAVNFETKTISGTATLLLNKPHGKTLILDTKDLRIDSVITLPEARKAAFKLGVSDSIKGSALEIPLGDSSESVVVYYQSSPSAEALQWLTPQQTSGGKLPFLYSQGEAILTRSWIPCQDSPGNKITYNARIRVPKNMMAVMSAVNTTTRSDSGIYHFKMPYPIAPYLIAIAAGDIAFKSTGPRTGVYAEPGMLSAVAYEFADMHKMLEAAEKLCGKYSWDRYDLIVLPPAFPFGGMENPMLTFATPTVLTGDRSLTALVTHELAHSWSGNLVTNATWNDFWLNEGMTVYIERRVIESLYGKDYADMLTIIGKEDLDKSIKEIGSDSSDTKLKLNLKGRDPDIGMSDIAYEKGYFFLRLVEEKVGRPAFDSFLVDYFKHFAFKSLTTEDFVDYMMTQLLAPRGISIEEDISNWIYGPGIPADIPKVYSVKFEAVDKYLADFLKAPKPETLKLVTGWSSHEWLHLIRALPDSLGKDRYQFLEKSYKFSTSRNNEILAAWLEYSVHTGHEAEVDKQLEHFLTHIGRRKFLIPLYQALVSAGKKDRATEIYAKARPNYHSVSVHTIDAMLAPR